MRSRPVGGLSGPPSNQREEEQLLISRSIINVCVLPAPCSLEKLVNIISYAQWSL